MLNNNNNNNKDNNNSKLIININSYGINKNNINLFSRSVTVKRNGIMFSKKFILFYDFHRKYYNMIMVTWWLAFTLILGDFKAVIASNQKNSIINLEPMFITRSEILKFVTDETILLPCEVANTGSYVVAWKRGIAIMSAGHIKVTPDSRVKLINGFSLQISNAVPQDAGDYTCQIATLQPKEITHTVEILVPPRIHHISSGNHLQVKKGEHLVRIECSASGNPSPNITWTRKNNVLPNGDDALHSNVLSLENVDRNKAGTYICTASNAVGNPAYAQVALHVLYPPEISVETPIVYSGVGQEAMLVCIIHGEAVPEVIWFKETMQIDTTERHIMENRGSRHTLMIRKVHQQDFGNYTCVAENQLGKNRKTLQLSGKPNAATFHSPRSSHFKDRYNISWTVDSHSPVEEFRLSFRRMPLNHGNDLDNTIEQQSQALQHQGLQVHTHHRVYGGNNYNWGNEWRNVILPAIPKSHDYTQGMSYMIKDLDPDQTYEVRVQAKNQYGWSDVSNGFLFSTASSDTEMRDLSVTYLGKVTSTASRLPISFMFNYKILYLVINPFRSLILLSIAKMIPL